MPALNAKPPVAASAASVAIQSAYGPSIPNAVIAPTTKCGWRAASVRVSRPETSTPDVTSTSAWSSRSWKRSVSAAAVEIEHHAVLARVADRERQRHAAANRGGRPRRRPPGRLDLDHLGTEVAEEPAGELAAVDGAVDDAQTGQGQQEFAHRANL